MLNNSKSDKQTLCFDKIGNPSNTMDYFLLAGIVLIGFSLRYYKLAGNLYSDELWINVTAASPFPAFYQEFMQDWVHPPLIHFLARAWVYIFGLSDLSGRLVSLIFGVLSIPLIYWLGKMVSGSKAGLIAASLLALSPVHIYHSQYGRHYSLFVFFVLLSMLAFLKVYYRPNDRNYCIFYCLCTILLVYTHYFGWLIVFCQSLFFIFLRYTFLKRWILLQAFILLSYIPWIILVLKFTMEPASNQLLVPGANQVLVPHIGWFKKIYVSELFNAIALFNGNLPLFHQRNLGLFLLGGISILSMKNIFSKDKHYRDSILFIFSCVVIPFILVYVVSRTIQPIWIFRGMLLSVPAYYLLISSGSQQFTSKKISIALMIIPILWMSLASWHYTLNEHRMPFEQISKYLERESESGDPILVENSWLSNPIFHYYKGKGNLYELRESNVSIVPVSNKMNLSRIHSQKRESGSRLILVTYQPESAEEFRGELFSTYRYVKVDRFSGYGEQGQREYVDIFVFKKR